MQKIWTEEEKGRYAAALELARRKHAGQFRIGGEAYSTHPQAVAELVCGWGYGIDCQIAALFHDLLEDTDATEEEILEIGGEQVLEAVQALTKRDGYRMEEYVAGIRINPMAKIVKAADRLHNLRCATAADEMFRKRYIQETRAWYMDFSPEIPEAVEILAESLKKEGI